MHVSKVIPKAVQPARSTKDGSINTKAWAKWADFQLLGDPKLEAMVRAVAGFVLDLREGMPTPWLVLLGASGAGKTHLARRVLKWWLESGYRVSPLERPGVLVNRGQFVRWSDFIEECRRGDSSRIDDMIEDRLLVLDDIGAGADARGWMSDKLYRILERRLCGKKATIVTANMPLSKLAEAYDARIASRLIRRGPDKVIEVSVQDYMLRSEPKP